jgi:hypothetical protein
MFEKINDLAEKVATRISMSRRGFFDRLGQAALGVVGVAGGLLAMPAQARAGTQGYCRVVPHVPPNRGGQGHPAYLNGRCTTANSENCEDLGDSPLCPHGAMPRSIHFFNCLYACLGGTCQGLYVDITRPCT